MMSVYNIRDSNISLLGSDLERRVREHAGAKESAWAKAGVKPGFQIWRVEKFAIVDCSDWVAHEKKYGTFYDGDSYIVLHTYQDGKDTPLRYDLHFWQGEHTTLDQAATAAFKAAELEEHDKKIYTMITTRDKVLKTRSEDGKQLIVREIPLEGLVMRQGIVYVLDKGPLYWQYNTKKSTAWARYKAAEYMMYLGQWRVPQAKFQVFDEGTPDEGEFLQAAGITSPVMDVPLPPNQGTPIDPPLLYRLNGDVDGWQVVAVPAQKTSLQSDGVYIMDDHAFPAVYTWLGKNVPEPQRRRALQYAQNYLNDKRTKEGEHVQVATTLVKVNEEVEPASFLEAFTPRTL
ncbi:hypothetical protein DFJ58DRAFT_854684 [Suillus subalutaceus]|uniref:uncharacterized protein n=1 Tax=Suillus subalutaceus TaxID=48586 RepID=UPI001B87C205|nr:uncharacterized protein DFJ58DRAFT_854684 [Suillus subalutaceus]KAG1842993.1 hypothetical protein DFJ58DRAFT_854684 [Suillus subalutaceus]